MDKDLLLALNEELNTLNIRIAVTKTMLKTNESTDALQTLKNNIIKAQAGFVKNLEELYYKKDQ